MVGIEGPHEIERTPQASLPCNLVRSVAFVTTIQQGETRSARPPQDLHFREEIITQRFRRIDDVKDACAIEQRLE